MLLAEVHRGAFVESRHHGMAAVARADGTLVAAWGDVHATMLPRSSCKSLQALPLVEEGIERAPERLALAGASHSAAALHVSRVRAWLTDLELSEGALLCGPQAPLDGAMRAALRARQEPPGRVHNVCSGKHAGFLAAAQRLGWGLDYIDPDHPLQRRLRTTIEEMTGVASAGHATDGCSAPNFATTTAGLATAMARMAAPAGLGPVRRAGAEALVAAMAAHPALIAGEGRSCTTLMRAAPGNVMKSGAEGVYIAILPALALGVAVKAGDGAARAAEVALAAILARLGVLAKDSPHLRTPIRNRAGDVTGRVAPAPELWDAGRPL